MKTTQKSRAWGAWHSAGMMLLMAAAILGEAAQISYSTALSIRPTGWTNTWSLPQFDPALGTLQAVQIDLQSRIRSSARVENLVEGVPAPGTIYGAQGNLVVFDPMGVSLMSVAPIVKFTNNLAAYDFGPDYGGSSGATSPLRLATASES